MPHFIESYKAEQQQIRDAYNEHHAPLTPYLEANRLAEKVKSLKGEKPNSQLSIVNCQVEELLPLIDWRMFLLFWGFKGETLPQLLVNPEAEKTLREG